MTGPNGTAAIEQLAAFSVIVRDTLANARTVSLSRKLVPEITAGFVLGLINSCRKELSEVPDQDILLCYSATVLLIFQTRLLALEGRSPA